MAINSNNYGGIFVEGVVLFIRWKLCTLNGCRRNDWCEGKKNFSERKQKENRLLKFHLKDEEGVE
jgi:hypothetical protein